MQYLIIYLLAINLVTCILYGADKLMAMFKTRRIPEKTLIGFALVGGSLGALIGMQAFRHKTRHRKFQLAIPIFLALHAGILVFVFMKLNSAG